MTGFPQGATICPRCRTVNPSHRLTCQRCGRMLRGAMIVPTARPMAGLEPVLPAAGRDARRAERRIVTIAGATVEGTGVLRHNVTIVNLTPFGLQLQSPLGISPGRTVRLQFQLDGASFDATGVVRYANELPRGMPPGPPTFACGVELREALRNMPSGMRPAA